MDAFNALYRQLGSLAVRIAEAEHALETRSPASVVLALADLNVAWSLLSARRALLEAVTGKSGGHELWALPAMQLVHDESHGVLAQGARYVVEHRAAAVAVIVQLRRLSARLAIHEEVRTFADADIEPPRGHW